VTIRNIVSSADLGERIDLNAVAVGIGLEDIEYEPEQFPDLVYCPEEREVVALLFGTGKTVITGAVRREDALRAFRYVGRSWGTSGCSAVELRTIFVPMFRRRCAGRDSTRTETFLLAHLPLPEVVCNEEVGIDFLGE